MNFQPNLGSSLYKLPQKILPGQRSWNSPFGTLRLSDHWNYQNKFQKVVYLTDKGVPEHSWCLCVNSGEELNPWRVLHVFTKENGKNIIMNIDFKEINEQISSITSEAAQ